MAHRRRKARSRAPSRRPRRLLKMKMKMPRVGVNLRWMVAPFAALARRCNAHVMRRSLIGLSWLAAVGACVSGWVLGVPRLQAFAAQQRFASKVEVRFLHTPA